VGGGRGAAKAQDLYAKHTTKRNLPHPLIFNDFTAD